MITARYVEIRSRKLPGQPTETIIRTVASRNGHGRKTVRVLRNGQTVSTVSEPLSQTENSNIQVRRFTPNLYTSAENKTRAALVPDAIASRKKTRKNKKAKKSAKRKTSRKN
jgi:hypothetical protein